VNRISGGVLALVLALLSGGCAPPQEGEPCNPGDGPYLNWAAEYPGDAFLGCTGPAGCEGEADFHWDRGTAPLYSTWCGCDGVTFTAPGDDFIELPNRRWQWMGSCEAPCEDVRIYSTGTGYNVRWVSALPVAEVCTRCRDALLDGADCVNPDGLVLPAECCDCYRATLAPDGSCRHRDIDLEVASTCCD